VRIGLGIRRGQPRLPGESREPRQSRHSGQGSKVGIDQVLDVLRRFGDTRHQGLLGSAE
jgi:hypothetical protein